jgi:glycosyltransferase involved in cell wall biosynthesis
VRLLPELVRALINQTVAPDEIVVSISECQDLPSELAALASQAPRLTFKTSAGRAYAGRNRNIAAAASTADVLIYQDADDLPHPQRVEIVKRAFEHFEIDHLAHWYVNARLDHAASSRWPQRYGESYVTSRLLHNPVHRPSEIHNGNIATSREVFRRVRWSDGQRRGQDVAYNQAVYRVFHRTARIPLPLVLYRQQHTSDRSTI